MIKADRIVPTTCPYCGVGCQIDLHLSQDHLLRVTGRRDNQVNQGNLCVKGRFGLDFIHAPDRLREPLLRTNGGGSLQPAAWDLALNRTTDDLRRIAEESGPESIAFLTSAKCTNEENYLLQKLARGVIGTNHVDHCARL